MLLDYHMHLVGDEQPYTDAVFTRAHIEAYVEAAAAAGVAEIGFSDHVYRFTVARDWIDCDAWRAEATEDLGRYVAAVAGAREAGLPVLMGLELDWVADRAAEIAQVAAAHDWDYLIGSYHWLGHREIDHAANSIWDEAEPDDVWRMYVEGFCEAAGSGLYDSMAHPDLAKVFGHRPDPEPLELYRAMADAAYDGEVCIEISTAGLRKPIGEIYPSPLLLERFAERQVPITLGSDTHAAAGVGAHFDRARALAAAAGYRTITQFRRRERLQVPL